MTATTATRWVPTTADIEAALAQSAERHADRATSCLVESIGETADVVDHTFVDHADELVQMDEPYQLWCDLPPSQAARLHELVEEANARAFVSARAAIIAELVTAAVQFASEYPDATRPEPVR